MSSSKNSDDSNETEVLALASTSTMTDGMDLAMAIADDTPRDELFDEAIGHLTKRWNDQSNHVEGCLGDSYSTLLAMVQVVQEEWIEAGKPTQGTALTSAQFYALGVMEGQLKALRIFSHGLQSEINRAYRVEMIEQLQTDPLGALKRMMGDERVDVKIVRMSDLNLTGDDDDEGDGDQS